MPRRHPERHNTQHVGWLRAAVLGANDGIVSTASLIAGVAASGAGKEAVLVAGVAGLVAGAMSMAAGEYVSVSSQADTERADLARERRELETDAEHEREELASIYVERGLTRELAFQVADQMTAHDALAAHARDELGITRMNTAKPIQASFSSALTFALGAGMPIGAAWLTPAPHVVPVVMGSSLFFLAVTGAMAAKTGGASMRRAAWRLIFWGMMAMGITFVVGKLFGTTVS